MSIIKRAALYIRVSTDEQARHGLSLGEQRRDLEEYAKRNNYAVVGIYADEGTSARKAIHRRKELQRLLDDIRADKIDIVVVKDLERWMRSVRDFYRVQDILDEHNVGWECSQDRYNTTTANGKMQLNMRLAIAQDESDRDSERIRYVFEGKKKRKEVLSWAVPQGMSIVNKHVVFNERADMMRDIFNHVYNGGTVRSCITLAHERYGVKLSYMMVRRSLANRAYIGEMYGEPNYIEPMIPLDVFNKVQARLEKYQKSYRNQTNSDCRVYLFTGLIKCPYCGHALTGYRGDKKADGTYSSFFYRCNVANNNTNHHCNYYRCLYEFKVENFLLENIQKLLSGHLYHVKQHRVKKAKNRSELTAENIEAKLMRLKDLYVDGLIDKATYLEDYKKLQQQLVEITRPEKPLTTITPETQSFISSDDFRELYQSLTRDNKKSFWQSIIKNITYEDTPASHGKGGVYDFQVEFY